MPVTNYIWDVENDSYLMETDQTDTATAVYTNEPTQFGNLISQRRNNQTSYYHFDGLGSTRELTDTSQTVTDTNMYDAWGVEVVSSGTTLNPFRWIGSPGYYLDTDLGNFSLRERRYDGPLSRWLCLERTELRGSPGVYVYVGNSPLTATDPSGLDIAVLPLPEFPTFPPPGKTTGSRPNRKTLFGFNFCCSVTSKNDRLKPIPDVTALATPAVPPGPFSGNHTWYGLPYPSEAGRQPIGAGGCGPCIGVVIRCPSGVACIISSLVRTSRQDRSDGLEVSDR